jgi:site-specific DNA recombinase
MPQRCAIYARFSTDKQSAHSAEDQVAECTRFAEREGWEVVQVYSDLAISGTSNRRPGMTQMLADAASGAFDIVTAEAVDRLARNQADIASIFQRLEFANVAIHTLTEGRVNEMVIGFKGTMSAMFLKDLADKIRRGQRGTVERGRVPGGLSYGYEVAPRLTDRGELDRGHRRIHEAQADIVRRIFREFVAGRSAKAIAKSLNAEGVTSPRGSEWRASTIYGSAARGYGILRNPAYIGLIAYNRVQMRRDPDTRRRVSRVNPESERIEVEAEHLRIVDDALWRAAQDELEHRNAQPLHQQPRARHLLSGLMRCGVCGGSVIIVGNGRVGCARAREAGTCDSTATIPRVHVEQRVLAGLSNALLSPEAVSRLVARYHRETSGQQDARAAKATQIERQIAKLDRSIDRLVVAIADGAADFGEIKEALAARKQEREALQTRRRDAEAVPAIVLQPDIVERYRTRIRQLALSARSTTETGTEVTRRLRDLIAGVSLKPTNTGIWDIELHASLAAVLDIATPSNKRRAYKSMQLVAEEGLEPPTPGL